MAQRDFVDLRSIDKRSSIWDKNGYNLSKNLAALFIAFAVAFSMPLFKGLQGAQGVSINLYGVFITLLSLYSIFCLSNPAGSFLATKLFLYLKSFQEDKAHPIVLWVTYAFYLYKAPGGFGNLQDGTILSAALYSVYLLIALLVLRKLIKIYFHFHGSILDKTPMGGWLRLRKE